MECHGYFLFTTKAGLIASTSWGHEGKPTKELKLADPGPGADMNTSTRNLLHGNCLRLTKKQEDVADDCPVLL